VQPVLTGRAKAVLVALTFAAAAVLLWGFGRAPNRPAEPGAEAGGYRRVITMSPAVSEIAFALGAADRIVGVSQHTRWPPEAAAKPPCGGFFDPNEERILELEPDLIVAQGEAAGLARFARANGVALLTLELTDLESIFREMLRLGTELGRRAEAERRCADLRGRLEEVRRRVAGRPVVPVLLVTGREPGALANIGTAGPGTFLHDLIEVAGGRNVFVDVPFAYGMINKETLIERAPEVVIELHGEGRDARGAEREARRLWQGMPTLPAVGQGRVHVIESTYALIPGPRVVQLAERLADLLHGEESP
jgi:iron complex transport system substrate-binding protein